MRHFVSITIPEAAQEHLDDYLEVRRAAAPRLRWSYPHLWHVTLAFLPDVPEWAFGDLIERLEAACERRRPLTLNIAGGGTFGAPFAARVLWADLGVSGDDREELDRLAVGARHAAAAAGARVEGGEFVPHVTVARAPRPTDLTDLVNVLRVYSGPTWEARSIDLVASHTGGSVRHEIVGSFHLGPEPEEERYWWRRGIRGLRLPGDDEAQPGS